MLRFRAQEYKPPQHARVRVLAFGMLTCSDCERLQLCTLKKERVRKTYAGVKSLYDKVERMTQVTAGDFMAFNVDSKTS